MLTDANLRAQVDALWTKLWTGGLSNPLDAIEQLSFLIFLKRLDEHEEDAERTARQRGKKLQRLLPDERLRWSYWTRLSADEALKHVKEVVFPFIKNLGGAGGSFSQQMENAEFKINKPSLLIEACRSIDAMEISNQNQDVQGDLYEYLLSKLNTAGQNGQFRTPRHIIRMMVKMLDPQPTDRICDPAAGTCGFLVNAYQHILETHTRSDVLKYDEEGFPHFLVGDKLRPEEHAFLQTKALTGYDSDSGMTMLRIGSMNLMLHGISAPRFQYADTLSKSFKDESCFDVILANPPFKGAIDAADVNPTLPTRVKKTELLFLHLFLRLLENGGKAAVIVPDGVLFGATNAHVEIRRRLIEENRLEAVISMPSGVFRPYTGVTTAILVFTKGATTDRIWFYEMEHDGLSLDDKRQRVPENDIPDLLECWTKRGDSKFAQVRSQRLASVSTKLEPLKASRLEHEAIIHRLRLEEVIAKDADAEKARKKRQVAERELSELQATIAPLEKERKQLARQTWITKEQVRAANYDLSAGTYRTSTRDELFCEKFDVTLGRIHKIHASAEDDVETLEKMLKKLSGPSAGPTRKLGDLVQITGGGTPSRDRPEFFQGTIPWLTPKDMRDDYIWDTEEHITEEAIASSATKLVPANSILVVVKSKVLMHRLPVALTKVPMCHGQDIKSIQCGDELHHEFVRCLLKFNERRLLDLARGANTEGLTLPMLEDVPVPYVAYKDQEAFALIVERYDRLWRKHREAIRQAEHLFHGVLSRAFETPSK